MRRFAQPYRVGTRPIHRGRARPQQRTFAQRWYATTHLSLTTVAIVSLEPMTGEPQTRTLHKIKVRARKSAGSGTVTLKAALYEGSNNRSTDLETTALTTSFAEYTLNIDDANAALIGSYANLELRFWGTSPTGDTVSVDVADIWLETPTAVVSVTKKKMRVYSQAVHRASRW